MNDQQLLRYSRHILLDDLGIAGQERLMNASALVVGAGGLGSPAALYLAAAGVGTLTIADGDRVDLSNLQRQILHTETRVGMNKARSAQTALALRDPGVRVIALERHLSGAALEKAVRNADLTLDCSDNFATRHAVNRACVQFRKPLISGAAIGFTGQVGVFDLRLEASPCYHCLFPEVEETDAPRCAQSGVFAPLTGVIGAIQAGEAIKLLAGMGETLTGRLLQVDALNARIRTANLPRDPQCGVCGNGAFRPPEP
ncbi:MAG: molybdopterin-synthase adenylyltransferase MoeB [Zoogloeaceae bacterium]|jgi:adenylyltransferase/sulfurtransferase|nr:molybdopterin-synthase adenylyltransferase MoeB [Zoogloeaceae bacterium]